MGTGDFHRRYHEQVIPFGSQKQRQQNHAKPPERSRSARAQKFLFPQTESRWNSRPRFNTSIAKAKSKSSFQNHQGCQEEVERVRQG